MCFVCNERKGLRFEFEMLVKLKGKPHFINDMSIWLALFNSVEKFLFLSLGTNESIICLESYVSTEQMKSHT